MNKQQILEILDKYENQITVEETDEKIVIEIRKKESKRKQTLEELGFSFEMGM